MATKMILNEALPDDLRRELDADAQSLDITLNEAAIRILSGYYNLPWNGKGPYRPSQAERFKLRVPEKLHRAIRMEAARKLLTARGVVLNVLALHYGTETISPKRRPRKEVA